MKEPSFSLRLLRPVTLGTGRSAVRYDILTLRQPDAAQAARAAEMKSTIDSVIMALSLVCEVPQNVIERLCPRDFYAAVNLMTLYSESISGQ